MSIDACVYASFTKLFNLHTIPKCFASYVNNIAKRYFINIFHQNLDFSEFFVKIRKLKLQEKNIEEHQKISNIKV